MNFKDFYTATEQRIIDSILSLWATGDAELQQYLRKVLEKERLLAKPVFQNAFPWEPHSKTFEDLSDVFKEKGFIKALDKIREKEFRFPKTQHPYKHQLESWKSLLEDNKSIVVTTGTGSGKTECFMLPVLYDIYENSRNSEGINAIFLYPLNALIGSQKKRVHAWAKALGGINHAVYNGNTEHDYLAKHDGFLPELKSREAIRETPPQVLFTNPTMLEYILVRNKDVDILEKSQGKLRWILLDEAHTLTGSKATEMAMLIRRVLDAFGVRAEDVRFAATSATVGKDADLELLKFMAGLCGIHESQIKIIKGNRILPNIGNPSISGGDWGVLKSAQLSEVEKYEKVHEARNEIYKKNALTSDEIGKFFNINSILEQLELVDLLAETQANDNSIFPVRGHFFARSVGGVYVCTNKDCSEHKVPDALIGSMTTIATKTCKCGWPVLELVQCRSCSNHLLHGEKYTDPVTLRDHFRLNASLTHDAFQLDDDADQGNEHNNSQNSSNKIYAVKYNPDKKYIDNDHLTRIGFQQDGVLSGEGEFITANENNQDVCPHCGESANNPIHFRISASFLNRTLADIILEQTPINERVDSHMLWQGHKFISFTDSRQGTAKIAALVNIDNEKNWIQSQVFHALSNKRKSHAIVADKEEIIKAIRQLEEELKTTTPLLRKSKENDLKELQIMLENAGEPAAFSSRIKWSDLYAKFNNNSELSTLLLNTKRTGGASQPEKESFLKALIYDQYARRLPRERSSENLGLVSIVFPDLDTANKPEIANDLGLEMEDWQSLLKIAADYLLRMNFHFEIPNDVRKFSSTILSKRNTRLIYPQSTDITDVNRWPRFDKSLKRPNRLALLICAGLGYTSPDEITARDEDNINEFLEEIWKTIRRKLLITKDLGENAGYYLNIEEKAALQLTDKVWLCPVKRRLIDCHFKGYSPWITGHFSEENIRHFKLGEPFQFPYFPYPYHNNNGDVNKDFTRSWIESVSDGFRNKGIWNNLLERIILGHDLFLAGEHSAQISATRLVELEKRFEEGKLNILSCSTTMEMGVDIGGISAVVMNNVPPKPANYLQRAGRAGRRNEAKSLSLTICAPNPIGANVMKNPMWALEHKIAPPFIAFNSPVIAERHVNAFFMGKFLQNNRGINIRETINGFFFADENSLALAFQGWITNMDVKELAASLKRLTKDTPLENKTSLLLRSMVVANFDSLFLKTRQKKEAYEDALAKIIAEGYQQTSPRYKAVNYKFQQFLQRYLLGYLAEEGFIPSAGLPNGVVEFDTVNLEKLRELDGANAAKRDHILSRENPSFHIVRALSEYAPGRKVVIDGLSYVSRGITLKSQWSTAGRDIIQSCSTCGYQRKVEVTAGQNVGNACPHCENNTLRGLRFIDGTQDGFTEIIEPAGFAIDLYASSSRDVSENSPIHHVEPLLLGVDPWSDQPMSIYDMRHSNKEAEIIFYNMGFGNGYTVCLHCGRTAFSRDGLIEHRRLRGGKDNDGANRCSGNDNSQTAIRDRVILAGRIQTDYCEIRFRDQNNQYSNDESLLWSLGVVVTKAFAGYLGVEEGELDFGVKRYQNYRSLFIFDTATGGAGYAVQFSYFAQEIFEAAQEILNCTCETACTECLIDRGSQWYINKLDRHLAAQWLERTINLRVPQKFLDIDPELKTVLGSVKEDILRLKTINQINAIRFFVNNQVSGWDIDNGFFISQFRKQLDKDCLGIVVKSPINYDQNNQNILTALQVNSWAEIFEDTSNHSTLRTLCEVELKNGNLVTYYAEDFNNEFNQNWGATSALYRKNSIGALKKLNKISINLPREKFFDVKIQKQDVFKSSKLANVLISSMDVEKAENIKEKFQGEYFDIEYTDRYLNSPLAVWLFIKFLKGLEKEWNFKVSSLSLRLSKFENDKYPGRIFHNYFNNIYRDNELKALSKKLGIPNLHVDSSNKEDLPHYRFFLFKNSKKEVMIRPDGGVAHGWKLAEYLTETDLTKLVDFEIIKQDEQPLLYTILIK